jgi:hypothetical protein
MNKLTHTPEKVDVYHLVVTDADGEKHLLDVSPLAEFLANAGEQTLEELAEDLTESIESYTQSIDFTHSSKIPLNFQNIHSSLFKMSKILNKMSFKPIQGGGKNG